MQIRMRWIGAGRVLKTQLCNSLLDIAAVGAGAWQLPTTPQEGSTPHPHICTKVECERTERAEVDGLWARWGRAITACNRCVVVQ